MGGNRSAQRQSSAHQPGPAKAHGIPAWASVLQVTTTGAGSALSALALASRFDDLSGQTAVVLGLGALVLGVLLGLVQVLLMELCLTLRLLALELAGWAMDLRMLDQGEGRIVYLRRWRVDGSVIELRLAA
jgi:hypothetical protein